jgi:hypothetical protein
LKICVPVESTQIIYDEVMWCVKVSVEVQMVVHKFAEVEQEGAILMYCIYAVDSEEFFSCKQCLVIYIISEAGPRLD